VCEREREKPIRREERKKTERRMGGEKGREREIETTKRETDSGVKWSRSGRQMGDRWEIDGR
jgi:hypothetical protein